MSAGRRPYLIVPGLLLAILLISTGAKLGQWGFGAVMIAIVLAMFLPYESVKATLHTAGVAHHKPGDPTGPAGVGVVLHAESGEVLGEVGRSIGESTNTVADYSALI